MPIGKALDKALSSSSEPLLVTKEMDLDCLHYVSSDFYSWYRTK